MIILLLFSVEEGPSVSTSLDVNNQKRCLRKEKQLLCCTVCLTWLTRERKWGHMSLNVVFIYLFLGVVGVWVCACVRFERGGHRRKNQTAFYCLQLVYWQLVCQICRVLAQNMSRHFRVKPFTNWSCGSFVGQLFNCAPYSVDCLQSRR